MKSRGRRGVVVVAGLWKGVVLEAFLAVVSGFGGILLWSRG